MAKASASSAEAPQIVEHVLTADDSLMRLAIRYGSEEGAIMALNNLINADVEFLPLRKVEKRLKPHPDGSIKEVEVVVHEGTTLKVPILHPSSTSFVAPASPTDQKRALEAEERHRRQVAIAALMSTANGRVGDAAAGCTKIAKEEAEYYLSEHAWDLADAFKALQRDEAWERAQAHAKTKAKTE